MIKSTGIGLRRVSVHWHFRKKLFSICQNGIVVQYATCVWLHNAEFRVGVKGRDRVRREGQKNVHARIYGDLYMLDDSRNHYYRNHTDTASYNPYLNDTFITEDGSPVYKARNVMINAVDGKPVIEIGD